MKRTRVMMALLALLTGVVAQAQNIVASEVDARNTLLVPRLSSLPSSARAGSFVYKMGGADSGLYLRRVTGNAWVKVWPSAGAGGGVDSFYYRSRRINDTTWVNDRSDGRVDTIQFSLGPGGSGGASLAYPFTVNRYLNGYGNWAALNSDSLTEGSTNLFFSNARARAAISLTTSGNSGAATYSAGVLNVPNYTLAGLGGLANPMTSTGDLIVGGASGAATRLGIGTNGQVLTSDGTTATWTVLNTYPRDSVAVRRISQGTFNHYIGFNSGVGGTGTSGGNVTNDGSPLSGENLALFKDAGFSMRTSGRFDGQNMFIGTRAGRWATNASYNIALGYETLGGANTSLADSLWATTGSGSHVAIGFQALSRIRGNDAQNNQVAIGRGAMQNYTSCSGCTNSQVAIGAFALASSTTSQKNTAIGGGALTSVLTSGDNTAVGFNALSSNTGQSNTAVGSQALQSNTNQQGNSALGFNAGVLATGGFNTFFGWSAGGNLSVSGSNNTSVGAGNVVGTSGSDNVSIGASIGVLSNTANNQLAIGSSGVRWIVANVNGSTRNFLFNGTTADVTSTTASAALEVRSTTAGFLPPTVTIVQRNAISSPANGLIVFCSDCTATDGSTGVSQTYSSGAWRNHY